MGGHDRFDIAGKVAIVTGAASGIGLAIAEAMAEGGAKVALLDLDQGGLEQARDRLRKIGSDAVLEKVDVSNRTEMRRAIDSVADHFGGLASRGNELRRPRLMFRVHTCSGRATARSEG